jgi:hypothetical protein
MTVNDLLQTNGWLSNKLREADERAEQWEAQFKSLQYEFEKLLESQKAPAPRPVVEAQ